MNEESSSSFTSDNIEKAVPSEWKYKVLNKVIFGSPPKLEVCLKVALFTFDEIESWVQALEEKVQCSYSIQTTRKCVGEKVVFKRRLRCQHKTRDKNSYPNLKTGTRNTNCPSRLTISLMKIQKKYRGKDPPDPEMPCIIDYVITHNHSPKFSVRYRRVNRSVHEKLKELFSAGYNASTAYEYIKVDIQLNNPSNYEELLINRSVCPDRNFCHRWYNLYVQQHGSIDFTDKTFLVQRLKEFNEKMGEECTDIYIEENNFVLVLCPPLFKRVHKYIEASSEIIFIASINPSDNDGSKAFFLSTHSECGVLPLGIIITSAETSDLIVRGLKTLQNLVGDVMFGGAQQPNLFVLDDCEAEHIALSTLWPASHVIFCPYHILHTLWRYLLCTKNGIHRDDGLVYFKQFRKIMVATTQEECDQMCSEALETARACKDYLKILEAYWEVRSMWTVAYRNASIHHQYKDILTINDPEMSLCILKGSIYHRMKSFNVIQLTDFLLTKFVDYYTERLLDGCNGRLIRNMSRKVPVPIDIEKIQQINNYLYWVPSVKAPNMTYIVNSEILACTCFKNNTGYICFHIGWLLEMTSSFQEKCELDELKNIFYTIATGRNLDVDKREEVLVVVDDEQLIQSEEMFEIVHDDYDSAVSNEARLQTMIVNETDTIQEGERIIRELSDSLEMALMKSPFKILPALRTLFVRTNNLTVDSDNVDSFVAACEAFALLPSGFITNIQ